MDLSQLPAIDRLLQHSLWDRHPHLPHSAARDACRAEVTALREALLSGQRSAVPPLDEVAAGAVARALSDTRPLLRRVINATGVVVHTNLGRAPLAPAALEALQLAGRYTNLELDLDSGQRDSRHDRLGAAFARILGCGDVVVVNNNASAVYLALSALQRDGGAAPTVAISRGEQVEIGGSFRMPDIMAATGATMLEVGATNRTHLHDYSAALDDGADVLLKVNRSNFRIEGFTAEVSVAELGALARERGVPLVHDLGSGLLQPEEGLAYDTVTSSLDAGASLVLFSGDKLLGGPQCGIAAGSPDLVRRMLRHPLMRMLRPGKLTLLALEATLRSWETDRSGALIPVARMRTRDDAELRGTAYQLGARLAEVLGGRAAVEVVRVDGRVGGGAMPGRPLPSWAVAIAPVDRSEATFAAQLRHGEPSVVARVEGGRVLLDVRTLLQGDAEALAGLLGRSL